MGFVSERADSLGDLRGGDGDEKDCVGAEEVRIYLGLGV